MAAGKGEKIEKLGIQRDNRYMYFVRDRQVWRVPNRQSGLTGRAEKVQDWSGQREEGFLYYVDKQGDVARVKAAVGGQKRKTTKRKAAKPAARRPAKKTAAKKSGGAKKKAPARKAGAKRKK